MSAIAKYFHTKNFQVSGSDKSNSKLIEDLIDFGIKDIWTPHNKERISHINPDVIVYSTAIVSGKNEEHDWAKLNNKIIMHRSEALENILSDKKVIAITGTHGKTTTTAMTCEMFESCNENISGIVGGIIKSKNSNIMIGNSDYFVIEADESDKSFLKCTPYIGVITNIEPDHLENYDGKMEEIEKCFIEFCNKTLNNNGYLIVCADDKITSSLIKEHFPHNNDHILTYGFHRAENGPMLSLKESDSGGDLIYKNSKINTIKLKMPGKHNLLNATAVYGIGLLLKLKKNLIVKGLENYSGVSRRFEYIKRSPELTIVDDYAHHPTEITATINAALSLNPKRLVVILQPHQPTRVRDLWDEFISTLSIFSAQIYITDIYIARGDNIEGVSSKLLVDKINKSNIKYLNGDLDEISNFISLQIQPGDFILTLGAGDITKLGYMIAEQNIQKQSENNITRR